MDTAERIKKWLVGAPFDMTRDEDGEPAITDIVESDDEVMFTMPDFIDPTDAEDIYKIDLATGQLELLVVKATGQRWMQLLPPRAIA